MTDPTVIRATLGSNEGIRWLVRYRREEAVIGDVSRLKSRVSGLVSVTETVVDVAPLYQICRRRGVPTDPSDGEKERWWGIGGREADRQRPSIVDVGSSSRRSTRMPAKFIVSPA